MDPVMTFNALGANQIILIVLLSLWTIPWKGYALWMAARKSDKWWFIALLVINTMAILEILYIFWFSKRDEQS